MIPSGLFTQIAVVALSVGIIFTYIKPALGVVAVTQDNIAVYQDKITEVESVNNDLNLLSAQISNVSKTDKDKLATYIPNFVDTIAVPRDITFIAQESGLLLRKVTYDDVLRQESTEEVSPSFPKPHAISVGVDGTYGQIKLFLQLLEQNNYPLEISELNIQKIDGGFLSAEMKLVTYSILEIEEAVIN